MNAYEQYALAQQNPNLWGVYAKEQKAQKSAAAAQNVFSQLTGLDPESKEYYQGMRQKFLESPDLQDYGQDLNVKQQGYVFDNPNYTSGIKEYMLTSGDTQLQDRNALAAYLAQKESRTGTKVQITLPGQPGFDRTAPVPLDILEKSTAGNVPLTAGMNWDEYRNSGASMPGLNKPTDQAKSASYAELISDELINAKNLVLR